MKQNEFEFALETLNAGEAVMFGTIIRQFGSSPRGPGAKIVINSERKSVGTVGGGKQEAEVIKMMPDVISSHRSRVIDIEFAELSESIPDLRCGGNVSILLEPIYPEDLRTISALMETLKLIQRKQYGWLLSRVPSDQRETFPPAKCVICSDGKVTGNLLANVKIEEHLLSEISIGDESNVWKANPNQVKTPQEINIGRQTYFLEPVGQFRVVNIVGTGHVAQKLAFLSSFVGFQTIVIDDRCDFLNDSFFPNVSERIQVSDFRQVFDQMVIDRDSFIFSMTRAHLLDQRVISQALKTDAGYIGMIGSLKKAKTIFSMLEKEGFSEKDLERIHSPIGIPIGAETPEEIAISVLAEIIKNRSNFNDG